MNKKIMTGQNIKCKEKKIKSEWEFDWHALNYINFDWYCSSLVF